MNWLFEPFPVEVDIVLYFSLLIVILICLVVLRRAYEDN